MRITRTLRRFAIVLAACALGLSTGRRAAAQETVGGGRPDQTFQAGWTFTPTFMFGETYDTNVTLFGEGTLPTPLTTDYVETVNPSADLHYAGKHTQFGTGYSGSFLKFQTYTGLNRWDQTAHVDIARHETARLQWFAGASASAMPSTDLIDFGAIPYRRLGVQTNVVSGGLSYDFSEHRSFTQTYHYESINFDQTGDYVGLLLHGGHMNDLGSSYRQKLDDRLSVGGDYLFRRASVLENSEQFNIHTMQATVEYVLSQDWSTHAGAGAVYLQSTLVTPAKTGPAWTLSIERHRGGSIIRGHYDRSYIPAFGFGGTVQNQEAGAMVRWPLFGSLRLYTEDSLLFRNDTPLTQIEQQLPLRSLITYAILGWEVQNWARIEGFYLRIQQSSLRPGGQVNLDRVGVQIVTSKPMRLQ